MTLCTRLALRGITISAHRLSFRTCVLKQSSRPIRLPVLQKCRTFSTPPPQIKTSAISMDRYHELSDATMDALLEALEVLLDGLGNPNYEVEYHSGVLTLLLGEKGTYVINKQPPNKQIWLSSPFSGPKRYDYSEADDDWLYSRDGRALGDLLNAELSNALEQAVEIKLDGPAFLVS